MRFWFEPQNLADLRTAILRVRKKKIPLRVIGAGSNILVDDRGLKGIIVKLSAPYFKRITMDSPANRVIKRSRRNGAGVKQWIIRVGGGVNLIKLLKFAQAHALRGLELLAGIPGTLGGALVMNAQNIGQRVLDVTVMDRQGKVNILKARDIQFGYRSSNLNRYIVLSARLKLIKQNKATINRKIKQYLDYRSKTQDLSNPSCGCFFKNPDSKSAAYFIERCGLKGKRIGDAAVSSKHANFIINKGKASFRDVLRLMGYVTRRVKKRFKQNLQPEIRIWKRI